MPRSLWSGTISFGLVNVPIKLVTAVREKRISFNMLNEDGTCRLRQKLYCPETGEEYDFKQTARGYEIAPDQYVLIKDEELNQLKPEAGKTMEITEFVPLADIDPIYFDRSYYLLPNEGGSKGYKLLIDAMAESKMVGLAKFVMRQREHLAALRVQDGVLVAHLMHYADEVVQADTLSDDLPQKDDASAKEVEVAKRLIDALASEWEPDQYKDEYREAVQELIDAKTGKKQVSTASTEKEEAPPKTYNIMDALKASLEQTDKASKPASRKKKSTKKSTKKSSSRKKSA